MKFTSLQIILLIASFKTNAKSFKVPFSAKLVPQVLDSVLGKLGLEARDRANAPLINAVVKVVTSVQVGSGQKFHDVLIDTGSAVLWIGGEDSYQAGSYTQPLNATFGVGYGVGSVSGTAFSDKVTIGEATVSNQIIGAASSTTGFALVKPIDGILGLGPPGGSEGDISGPFENMSTPTFVEALVAERSIDRAMFGVFIEELGVDGVPEGRGELTFGDVDMTRIKGDVQWVAQNPPINFHWEFNVTAFSFGSVRLSEPMSARTDTGVLGIQIPFDSFFEIRDAFHGTISSTGALGTFLSFPSNATSTLPDLSFTLGETVFPVPPSRYLIPQKLYERLNLTESGELAHTWIASAGPRFYLLGQKWLENAYTAYDMENHRIGFARLA